MSDGDDQGLLGGELEGTVGRATAGVGDVLERVLDKGIVIAGDIQISLLDIELLTIKLRLVIASLESAREVGIDWWEHDPWLSAERRDLEADNRELRRRVAELESSGNGPDAIEASRRGQEAGQEGDYETEREDRG